MGVGAVRPRTDHPPSAGDRMGAADRIVVMPYDPEWPRLFAELGTRLRAALGSVALRIDHIGSTSIPGMAAKPVIDVQVSVAELRAVGGLPLPLEGLGFVLPRGQPGPDQTVLPRGAGGTPRRTFTSAAPAVGPSSSRCSSATTCAPTTRMPVVCRGIKHQLAEQYRDDRHGYTDAKGPYLWEIMKKADRWSQDTGWLPGPSLSCALPRNPKPEQEMIVCPNHAKLVSPSSAAEASPTPPIFPCLPLVPAHRGRGRVRPGRGEGARPPRASSTPARSTPTWTRCSTRSRWTASSPSARPRRSTRWPRRSSSAASRSTSRSPRPTPPTRTRWRWSRSPRTTGTWGQVGFMKRFAPAYLMAQNIMRKPEFGQLNLVQCKWGQGAYPQIWGIDSRPARLPDRPVLPPHGPDPLLRRRRGHRAEHLPRGAAEPRRPARLHPHLLPDQRHLPERRDRPAQPQLHGGQAGLPRSGREAGADQHGERRHRASRVARQLAPPRGLGRHAHRARAGTPTTTTPAA